MPKLTAIYANIREAVKGVKNDEKPCNTAQLVTHGALS